MNLRSNFTTFAKNFGIKKSELYLAYQNPSYSLIEIPKKNGDLRKVYAPAPTLKKVQRCIADKLNNFYQPLTPKNVMGFVKSSGFSKKRDILVNAEKHRKSNYLINLDIQNFFTTCNEEMITKALSRYTPIHQDQLEIFLHLCFFQHTLPPGSPASPVISNIIFLPIDRSIHQYCKSKNIKYTRYVDDLSFSSNTKISKATIQQIDKILQSFDFEINPEKTCIYENKDEMEVTGISIKDKKLKLCNSTVEEIEKNISYYHEWKQKVLRQYGAIPEVKSKILKMQKSIKGQLNFAKRVDGDNGKTYTKLRKSFEHGIDEKDFNFKLYI